MPPTGDRPRSPRDAIRDWLSKTEAEAHGPEDELRGHKPITDLRDVPMQDSEAPNHRHRRRSSKRAGANLAESLGLQAPFRSLASIEHHEGHPSPSHHRRRKRRRCSTSTTSSYLDPVVIPPKTTDSDHPGGRHRSRRRYPSTGAGAATEIGSVVSSHTVLAPEQPEKTYERRPRRKTREDRYDPKTDKTKHTRDGKEDTTKPRKRRRKRNSEAQLGHAHGAEDSSRSRLTLRPVHGLGLFMKGRASSPIRRGLPDLTFSEMTFLSNRRDRTKELNEPANQRKEKKKKISCSEEEISRFFESGRRPLTERAANRQDGRTERGGDACRKAQRHRQPTRPDRTHRHRPSCPPVDLPEKPFLGFGNRGANSMHSPVLDDAVTKTSPSVRLSQVAQHTPAPSTTYYTWSRSGRNSKPPSLHEDKTPSITYPAPSNSRPRAPSVTEVGQLDRAALPKSPAPLKEAISMLEKSCHCRVSPRESSQGAQNHASHVTAQQLRVDAITDPPCDKEEHKAGRELAEPPQIAEDVEGESTKKPPESQGSHITEVQQNVTVKPSLSEIRLARTGAPDKEVQTLGSLLDACQTTPSGLRSIASHVPLQAGHNKTGHPETAKANNTLSTENARVAGQGEGIPRESEGFEIQPGGPTEEPARPLEQSADVRPSSPGLAHRGFWRDQKGLPRLNPVGHGPIRPPSSTYGLYTQPHGMASRATAHQSRTIDHGGHGLQDGGCLLPPGSAFSHPPQIAPTTTVPDTNARYDPACLPPYDHNTGEHHSARGHGPRGQISSRAGGLESISDANDHIYEAEPEPDDAYAHCSDNQFDEEIRLDDADWHQTIAYPDGAQRDRYATSRSGNDRLHDLGILARDVQDDDDEMLDDPYAHTGSY